MLCSIPEAAGTARASCFCWLRRTPAVHRTLARHAATVKTAQHVVGFTRLDQRVHAKTTLVNRSWANSCNTAKCATFIPHCWQMLHNIETHSSNPQSHTPRKRTRQVAQGMTRVAYNTSGRSTVLKLLCSCKADDASSGAGPPYVGSSNAMTLLLLRQLAQHIGSRKTKMKDRFCHPNMLLRILHPQQLPGTLPYSKTNPLMQPGRKTSKHQHVAAAASCMTGMTALADHQHH